MSDQAGSTKLPSIVIVGRPNVGKSTLFNRLTGTRRSIVTDEPGITRDRIYGTSVWEGRPFEVVDTGGIVPDDKAVIPAEILRQAKVAIDNATFVVQIVDAREGPVALDQELALLLRRAGKPPIIAANKVDTLQHTPLAAQFYGLGDQVFPISAEHGFGIDEMLDSLTANFERREMPEEAPVINIAIIGRPNVGKSTLLNRLTGEERAIVSAEPGTTRDAVDQIVEHGGKTYRFLDTAGIRRKGKTKLIAEKLSVIMARKHLERADVALVVIDASMGVTSHDATIASYAEQSGCSVIVVMNKWDIAVQMAIQKAEAGKKSAYGKPDVAVYPPQLAADYEKIVRGKLKFLDFAPVVFLSALTGDRAEKLFSLIDRVAEARQKRVTTGEINRWLTEVDLDRGTSPAGYNLKIYYMTQASTAPPTFVLFTNQKRPLHFSYQRFLENQLRARFNFVGAPIRFLQRLKKVRAQRMGGQSRAAQSGTRNVRSGHQQDMGSGHSRVRKGRKVHATPSGNRPGARGEAPLGGLAEHGGGGRPENPHGGPGPGGRPGGKTVHRGPAGNARGRQNKDSRGGPEGKPRSGPGGKSTGGSGLKHGGPRGRSGGRPRRTD
jgi:GTP-binding protein